MTATTGSITTTVALLFGDLIRNKPKPSDYRGLFCNYAILFSHFHLPFHVRYAYIRAYFKLFLVKLLNFLFICDILTWIWAQARLFDVHFYTFYHEVPVSHKIVF